MRVIFLIIAASLLSACATGPPVADSGRAAHDMEVAANPRQGEAIGHYLTAIVQERTGNFAEALSELRAAADLAPDEASLQVRLLEAYLINQDYENAVVMAERAMERDPDNISLKILLGRTYYQLERVPEATQMFREAIELDPDNTTAYTELVRIEEDVNDLVGAVDTYAKLVEIVPDSPLLHFRLGFNLMRIEHTEASIPPLERALELNGELLQAAYLLGLAYLDTGDYEKAIARLEVFIAGDGNNANAMASLAGAHARRGEYDIAVQTLTELIESAKVDTEHHLARSFVMLWRGAFVDTTFAAAPNGAPIIGTLLLSLAKKEAGEPYAQLVQSLDTIDGDLDAECNRYVNELISLFGDDGGEFLVRTLKALSEEDVNSRTVEVVTARALMSMQRDREALPMLRSAFDTHGPDKWLHYYLGSVYDAMDEGELAEHHIRACIAYDQNDPDLLNFLGYLLAEENRSLDEAQELLERALAGDPENGYYLDSLGWVFYRQGRSQEAVDYILRAIRAMSSDDAVLRDHLGDAYLLNGEIDRAIEQWKRALRLDPELEGVQEKVRRYTRRRNT